MPSDHAFNRHFQEFRRAYRHVVAWGAHHPIVCGLMFVIAAGVSWLLFPILGMDFFPQVDAGQMRLHVRAPNGTRLEKTQELFGHVEAAIREIVGRDEVDVMLDNIGLPYSGINIALSDTATAGPMDGEILISLVKDHRPTAGHIAALRRELPGRFPEMRFFFQPADIVNQVLNFGQPSPIDIRVTGAKEVENYKVALKIQSDLHRIPGVVDVHLYQVPIAPALGIAVDRVMAQQTDMTQDDIARNVLLSLSSSAVVLPNFWINPRNQVSYLLVVQTPQYQVTSVADVQRLPLTGGSRGDQMLMNVADVKRTEVPMLISEANILPVFDVNADVQGRDLASAAAEIDRVLDADRPPEESGIKVALSGQVQTMRAGFAGIAGGMVLGHRAGVPADGHQLPELARPADRADGRPLRAGRRRWMLYLTHTHLSVPALMGTLMCIGLTTANSILVVVFARQRLAAGDDSVTAAVAAGYTRIRPVLMTAGAMILGMIPMAAGHRRGRRAERPARPGRHRRPALRHLRHPGFRAFGFPARAPLAADGSTR